MKRAITFILIIFCAETSYAQNAKIDSLTNLINKASTDTGRIKLMIIKVNVLSNINIDSSISLAMKTLKETGMIHFYRGEVELREGLASSFSFKGNYQAAWEQINYLKQFINASKDSTDFGSIYGSSGLLYGMQSKYDSSIYFYEKAIRIYKKLGSSQRLSKCYSNIAIDYQQKSNFPMALLYFQKSLKISEASKNEIDQAFSYVNIANTYDNMGDTARAEITYLKDIELAKKHQLKNVELYAYTNLSTMYITEEKWQKAYEFGIKAAELGGRMGDHGIEAASLSKAATSLAELNEYERAVKTAKRAIAIADSSAQPLNISQAYWSMGFVLKSQGKWREAITFYEKGFASMKDADLIDAAAGIDYRELSECYEKTGNYVKALSTYQKSAMIADSVGRKENIRKATELTMNYEFDKKEQTQKAEQKAKDAITRAQQLALIIGLVLSLIIIVGAYIGYMNKKRANALLFKQNQEIETQRNYLTSSINYAQRIQSAVFPSDEILSDNFPEHFILFKPLDVVSGDFYWCKQNNDELFVAVADCTGHGVPGAFMSILGITFLNEIVNKANLCSTSEILDRLRKNVIRTLHQSQNNNEPRDGMEVALCRFDLKNKKLQFAGAFRPIYLIRENSLHHNSGDSMPIGIYDDGARSFTANEISLQKDDIIYLFSDGYVDQIGGDDRKTFRTKRFKELLLEIFRLPMNEQKIVLQKRIEEWQGELEQIDDILVVGIKINV